MILFDEPPVVAATPAVAIYFNEDALREAPRRLYRYDGREGRFYYAARPDDETKVRIYPSVTTVQRQTGPMPPFLLKWVSDYGQRRADQLRQERADYGTLLHVLFGEFVIAGEMNLDLLDGRVVEWAIKRHVPWETSSWPEALRQDLVGLAAFLIEKDLEPLAVELPLASETHGFAGTIDLVARRRGTTEPVIVDFKSNRTAFFEEQDEQLGAYRILWDENFPEFKAGPLWLWGSKDWDEDSRGRYRFRSCKEGPRTSTMFPARLALWEQSETSVARRRPRISGHLKLSDLGALNLGFRSLEEELAARLLK